MITRSFQRLPVAIFIIAVLCQTLGCAGKRVLDFRLVPQPDPSYSVEGNAVTVKTDEFHLTVIALDDLARRAFIHQRAGESKDPFGPGPGGAPRYVTFRVFLENLGTTDPVTFQPQSVYLATETGDRLSPMDYPEAYTKLFGTFSNDPRFLEDLSKYMFDVGVSVPPGEHIEGLLAYPTVGKTARKLRMEFNFLQTGGSTSRNVDIYFRKEPMP